jgi:hypothetical protein
MLKAAAVRDHTQRGHALPLHHEELSDGGRHPRRPRISCAERGSRGFTLRVQVVASVTTAGQERGVGGA